MYDTAKRAIKLEAAILIPWSFFLPSGHVKVVAMSSYWAPSRSQYLVKMQPDLSVDSPDVLSVTFHSPHDSVGGQIELSYGGLFPSFVHASIDEHLVTLSGSSVSSSWAVEHVTTGFGSGSPLARTLATKRAAAINFIF